MRQSRSFSPQPQTRKVDIETMYELQVKKKEVFGIEGYQVPRKYIAHGKVFVPHRQAFSPKTKSQERKPAQKGFYLDNQLKQSAKSPSPQQYNSPRKWVLTEKEREKLGVNKPNPQYYHSDRRTYLDEVQRQSNNYPIPASNKYINYKSEFDSKLTKNQKNIKELVNEENAKRIKTTFLDEYQYRGSSSPGPGQYYPRKEIKTIKVDKRDLVYWKQKHRKPSPVKGVRTPPGVGTYNHHPLAYNTFAKIEEKFEEEKQNDKKNNKSFSPIQKQGEKFTHFGFGVSLREIDPKFSKSKAKLLPHPGPGSYNLLLKWSEKKKDENEQPKGQSLKRRVEKNMYYDSSPNLV